jgi:hypothetical protein
MLGIYTCRWDESDISLLPEYMKKFFLNVLRNFNEFEDELEPHEKYRVAYARKAVCNNYQSLLPDDSYSLSSFFGIIIMLMKISV